MDFLCKHSKFLLRSIIVVLVISATVKILLPYTSIYYRFFIFDSFGLNFTKQDIVLEKGESMKLTFNAINKRAVYSSSNFRIVSVNSFGKITALNTGISIISANVNKKTVKCRVRVVSLNFNEVKLSVGDTKRLRIHGSFFGGRYTSSNTSVIKINKFGKITAVGKGSATITVTVKGKKLDCKVLVR